MRFKFILFFLVTMFLASCGSGKAIIGSEKADSSMTTKEIIKTHEATLPIFNTIAARMQVLYEKDDDLQSLTVSLRMEKDKKIWIKASLLGITLAKLYITPESVSYYETISNTYFDGDFSLLSNWLGVDIDFNKAQAILLGQSIFDLSTKYKSQVMANKYKLQPTKQSQNFIYTLLVNPDNFKIASETLSQPVDNRMFTINYGVYQSIKGNFYPSNIKIIASEKESKTNIAIHYKKIDHNVSIRFPFTIPKGYEELELN